MNYLAVQTQQPAASPHILRPHSYWLDGFAGLLVFLVLAVLFLKVNQRL